MSESKQIPPDQQKYLFSASQGCCNVGTKKQDKEDVFEKDLDAINNAKIIIAVLDGVDVDSGTAVELGYSYVYDKKIFVEEEGSDNFSITGLNNMVWGVCEGRGDIYRTLEAHYKDVETYLMEFVNLN